MRVEITQAEYDSAASIGLARVRELQKMRSDPRFPYKAGASAEHQHVLGAVGEFAFCKGLGLVWPKRVNTFRTSPDVDPDWEVRTSPNGSMLKVATDDPPHYRVGQVTGEHGGLVYDIGGWCRVDWARKQIPAKDLGNYGRPAHFVPSALLSPIEETPEYRRALGKVSSHVHSWWKEEQVHGPSRNWSCTVCHQAFVWTDVVWTQYVEAWASVKARG